jgi:hypothetical protein
VYGRVEECPLSIPMRRECDNTTGFSAAGPQTTLGRMAPQRAEMEREWRLDRLGWGNAFVGCGAESIPVGARVEIKCVRREEPA